MLPLQTCVLIFLLSFSLSIKIFSSLYVFTDEYPKPRIVEEPIGQMSIKGDNVTLTCRATSTADLPLVFTWKHDNVELNNLQMPAIEISTTAFFENGATGASSVLQITNVTHANAGKYQCMVTNNYGTTYSLKAKLSVLSKLYLYLYVISNYNLVLTIYIVQI